jgi:GR25 family glycosyltransferase involved in LPS biosynthesis
MKVNKKKNIQFSSSDFVPFSFGNNKFHDLDSLGCNNFQRIVPIINSKKHALNKFFDAVFVINLETDTKRKKNILVFEDKDISYFYVNAISYKSHNVTKFCDSIISENLKKGTVDTFSYEQISLALTNILVLNYCIKNDIKSFLILEDDFLLHKNFDVLFEKYIRNIPNDWNIVWLGYKQSNIPQNSYNDLWSLPNLRTFGTHAYAINNCSLDVRNVFNKFSEPIDVSLTHRMKNLRKYAVKEQLIISLCENKMIGHNEDIEETYDLWNWELDDFVTETKKRIDFFDVEPHPGSYLKGFNDNGAWKTFREIIRSVQGDQTKVFFDFIDRDFGWDFSRNLSKINSLKNREYYGIMHYPYVLPKYLYGQSSQTIHNIFNYDFLTNFKTVFCLSEHLSNNIRQDRNIRQQQVNIETILHPSNMFDGVLEFNFDNFLDNNDKHLISLGGAFRKLNSIDKINLIDFKKGWLIGNSQYYLRNMKIECEEENYTISNETFFYKELEFKDYNRLLSNNLVFLHFIDSSASNSILECIARATPMFVNRNPAVVEYLGKDYPLYFDDLNFCETVINKKLYNLIYDAHLYLKQLPKFKFNFFSSFRDLYRKI